MISKINSFSPAFGSVSSNALKIALNNAKNKKNAEKEIKNIWKCYEEQIDNKRYDIEYVKVKNALYPDNGYGVINKANGNLVSYFPSLDTACNYANKNHGINHCVCLQGEYEIFQSNKNGGQLL